MPLRVLILGGTTEASALAKLVSQDTGIDATLSFAGRTANPAPQPIATRSGGFGSVDGLMRYLGEQRIEAVVDATHPFADQISAHAVVACAQVKVPLASLTRPPWKRVEGDRWRNVPDAGTAAAALGNTAHRVFLSVGRQDLRAFTAAPRPHYVARVIEMPDRLKITHLKLIQARGPFDKAAELDLLREEKIDVLVSKNAGGSATYAKIEAARELGLPVIMIARPHKPAGDVVASPEEALGWLHERAPSLRGV
ncbi:MAG TPA: cobalt-precorrin-6A reductase [Reyranella sp.]|nr:cobalt-precorrin-6A reductase [Reyranella sp.]